MLETESEQRHDTLNTKHLPVCGTLRHPFSSHCQLKNHISCTVQFLMPWCSHSSSKLVLGLTQFTEYGKTTILMWNFSLLLGFSVQFFSSCFPVVLELPLAMKVTYS